MRETGNMASRSMGMAADPGKNTSLNVSHRCKLIQLLGLALFAAASGCVATEKSTSPETTIEPGVLQQMDDSTNDSVAATSREKPEKKQGETSFKPDGPALGSTLTPVADVAFESGKIKTMVLSYGCTTSDHFTVEPSSEINQCEIRITRTIPDNCKAAPFLESIEIEWQNTESCSAQELSVLNPALDVGDMENSGLIVE